MAKAIRYRLKERVKQETPTTLVQARCDAELTAQAKELLDRDKLTWRDFVETAMQQYVEESRAKRA